MQKCKKMPNGQNAKKDAKTAKRPKMPTPLKMPGWHLGYCILELIMPTGQKKIRYYNILHVETRFYIYIVTRNMSHFSWYMSLTPVATAADKHEKFLRGRSGG